MSAKKDLYIFCMLTIYQVGDKINDASIDKKILAKRNNAKEKNYEQHGRRCGIFHRN